MIKELFPFLNYILVKINNAYIGTNLIQSKRTFFIICKLIFCTLIKIQLRYLHLWFQRFEMLVIPVSFRSMRKIIRYSDLLLKTFMLRTSKTFKQNNNCSIKSQTHNNIKIDKNFSLKTKIVIVHKICQLEVQLDEKMDSYR